jgi:hypothetical protein
MRGIVELARRIAGLPWRARGDHRAIFERIFLRNEWRDGESVSGPGSTRARGAALTPPLLELLRSLQTRVLVDAPCGDFNWIGEVADAVDEYVGVDVVPQLIAHNQERHAAPNRTFLCLDIARDTLPRGNVILCRDCLVHFSFADILTTLDRFRASGTPLLLTTTYVARAENVDIRTGSWRTLNLERAPFHFPPPLHLVDEQCLHTGGIYRDKRLALWEIASLPAGLGRRR